MKEEMLSTDLEPRCRRAGHEPDHRYKRVPSTGAILREHGRRPAVLRRPQLQHAAACPWHGYFGPFTSQTVKIDRLLEMMENV